MNRLFTLLLCGLLFLGLTSCNAPGPAEFLSDESAPDGSSSVSNSDETTTFSETGETAESTDIQQSSAALTEATAPLKNTSATTTTTTVPTEPPEAETVRVTLKSGESLIQMLQKMADAGVNTFDKLLTAAENYDVSQHPLTASMPVSDDRCYKLEGYLFPDTYEFYVGEVPARAIKRILQNTEAKITPDMRSRAKEMGYTMDQVITMASLIQREGSKSSEMPNIAAIIYNRMELSMRLQMDSSILYVENWIKPYISGDKDRYSSLYNTYKCTALPAGPIANPGLGAIQAVLYPSDVDYLYFCNDIHANYYYATSLKDHEAKVDELKEAGLLP